MGEKLLSIYETLLAHYVATVNNLSELLHLFKGARYELYHDNLPTLQKTL